MALTKVDIPSPLIEFITAHEIHCVAACCGEDAFDFTQEAIGEPSFWLRGEHTMKGTLRGR